MNTTVLTIFTWFILLVFQTCILYLFFKQTETQKELHVSLTQWQSEHTNCVKQSQSIYQIESKLDHVEVMLSKHLNHLPNHYERLSLDDSLPTSKQNLPIKEIGSDQLSKVWIMPYPPLNRGRYLNFISYSKQKNGDGQEVIIFEEWNGSSIVQTPILLKELRWNEPK